MKTIGTFFKLITLLFISISINAQNVDEIITTYHKNIGGIDKLKAIKGIKMDMSVNYQGMEIPVEMVQLKEGKMYVKINFQGQEITQFAFDGTTAWSTNFMTMKAEKADAETTSNMKDETKDYPDAFIDYKAKGYKAELLGKETKEGAECFKIKLTKTPQLVDGAKVENVVFYYFDTENYVPILTESEIKSGPAKGQMSKTVMSDYQEVDGLYFPFTMNQGGQAMSIKKITLNPTIDSNTFLLKE